MHKFLPIAYFEDKFVPFEDAKISVATHALHYGTAAFGGLRGIPDPEDRAPFYYSVWTAMAIA